MSASSASFSYVEPWLRGSHTEVPAVGRAVLHALELAQDDIARWTDGLSELETHAQPLGLPAIAFHLKHIARSIDRILTYAEGNPLTADQLGSLKSESGGSELLSDLVGEVETSLRAAGERIRALSSADLDAFRGVGRKQLPTSVGGALIHVADHTQRHVGQLVTTAKVIRALRV